MKISIALATYNGARYLQDQLESFLAQTRLPDEVVVNDDGSTDETLDLVRRFSDRAPFPVVWSLNARRLGFARNFSLALRKSTGDLVFLSDQDDVWFPEKIERLAAVADADPEALVIMNDAALTDEALRETGLTKLGQIRSAGISDGSFVMGCCAAIRREFLDLCLPIPDGVRAHDVWLVRLADGLGRKRIIPDVLQYYRRHGDNKSQWITSRTTRVSRWQLRAEAWQAQLRRMIKGRQPPTPDWTTRLGTLQLEWARDIAAQAPAWLQDDLARFQATRQRREDVIQRRRQIQRLPLRRRLVEVPAFLRSGGYARFSGVKSAVRDLVAPPDLSG